ncbi:hypothetical protein nbrc107696_20570 [Gordonia spumicola]|uniref:Uncharacterized protein n=1 Tax=Gordonia spumicola TaxID=589161 RepID=A0A7I9V921_9ACTN|nr:hypothetical protein [Gordonia spumicola]GEE01611.1 hypothetical protein nbrc107696_20570 [Gordonia spumicola]
MTSPEERARLERSARERAGADFILAGRTSRARQSAANILVKVARLQGEEPEQWVLDVAEGRLPA